MAPITVDLVDEDGTFLNRGNPFSVIVDNVTPSIVLTGNATCERRRFLQFDLGGDQRSGARYRDRLHRALGIATPPVRLSAIPPGKC